MPRSQQPVEGEQLILDEIRGMAGASVLDVGAGDGKWGKQLFLDVHRIDAVEVWPPNAEKILGSYDAVWCRNIKGFPAFSDYSVVILGDVLEHLDLQDAYDVLNSIPVQVVTYLTIPISLCIQDGMKLGNPYETHLAQWTHEEVISQGFTLLHRGFNEAGTVEVGTYRRG